MTRSLARLMAIFLIAAGLADVACAQTAPAVYISDAAGLARVQARVRANDSRYDVPLETVIRDAEVALTKGPFSVTKKTRVPPSGDRRDYLSMAPYWWPNPDTANRLPYVPRDGRRNPEVDQIPDRVEIYNLVETVEPLALAWYLTGQSKYANKAIRLLAAFFLEPSTRMNPHLRFGQHVPGVAEGKASGIVDTEHLPRLIDAMGLLKSSTAWSVWMDTGMRNWFSAYMNWLLTSKLGKEEGAMVNNQGTLYDLQVISYALFTGKRDFALTTLRNLRSKRIATQIKPSGQQPYETSRPTSWDYSIENLEHLVKLAMIGKNTGVPLWGYSTPEGAGIKKALDFLIPYAFSGRTWPYTQYGGVREYRLYTSLRFAANLATSSTYLNQARSFEGGVGSSRNNLLLPVG